MSKNVADKSKAAEGKAKVFEGCLIKFPNAIYAIAELSGYGSAKRGNEITSTAWADCPIAEFKNALSRHIVDSASELRCPESGLLHATHAAWNALAILELELIKESITISTKAQPITVKTQIPNPISVVPNTQNLTKPTSHKYGETDLKERIQGAMNSVIVDPYAIETINGAVIYSDGTGDFTVGDISHGISKLCSYSKYINRYYSVANHSIVMADYLELHGYSVDYQLAAMLYNTPEAIMLDISSEMKYLLPEDSLIESSFLRGICNSLGVPDLFTRNKLIKIAKTSKQICANDITCLEIPTMLIYNPITRLHDMRVGYSDAEHSSEQYSQKLKRLLEVYKSNKQE